MHIHNAVMMSNHYVEQANLKRFPIETFSLVHFLLNTSFESFLTYQIPFIPSPIINFIEQKSRIRDNQSKIRPSNSKLKHFLYKTFPYTILQLAYLYISLNW